jgi:hypothetical protein
LKRDVNVLAMFFRVKREVFSVNGHASPRPLDAAPEPRWRARIVNANTACAV